MLGIEDYGSDSEGEVNVAVEQPKAPPPTPASKPNSASKSDLALPPPKASSSTYTPSSSSSLKLPAPSKGTTKKGPKKITLELPKLEKGLDDEDTNDKRPVKRQRTTGKGASALLSMLPPPKKSGLALPDPTRVLGGGRPNVVYNAATKGRSYEDNEGQDGEGDVETTVDDDEPVMDEVKTTSLVPPSLLKGKARGSTKAEKPKPAVDFFSLGSTSKSTGGSSLLPSISSASYSAAPKVEDFRPPSPTLNDPYPGFYQKPSGAWAQYDPEYYETYTNRWSAEYNAQIRKLEKGMDRGFEGADGDATQDISGSEQMDLARKEREERMSLTKGAKNESERKMPNMTINPSKMSGLARSRHQLSTMLTEAYMNREAMEEKIAQAKRNRKEAGNKFLESCFRRSVRGM